MTPYLALNLALFTCATWMLWWGWTTHRADWRAKQDAHILSELTQFGELYGLELVATSEGLLSRGTVYVILGRMERARLIVGRDDPDHTGPGMARRMYTLPGDNNDTT